MIRTMTGLCLLAALAFGVSPCVHAGSAVQTITFLPASALPGESVTAILPGGICDFTVVDTPGHIDIDYHLAPCAFNLFTDRIPLGVHAPGTYVVNLNLEGALIATGTFGVAAATAPLPTTGPIAAGAMVLSLALLGARSLRRRRPRRSART